MAEGCQHVGIGHRLLMSLLLANGEHPVIAFGNAHSAPIFEKLGAKSADLGLIPAEAFALCANCPAKPPVGCCDTIFDLTPVILQMVTQESK